MASRKVLFLDRDGTVNVDKRYLFRPEEFEWVPGILDVCRAAQNCGLELVVITNQSGIARGFYSEVQYESFTAYMKELFVQNGTPLLDVLHCPLLDGPDRKPEPGMFLRARDRWNIDMARSFSLGDKERDIEAALRAGVGTNVLYTPSRPDATRAAHVVADLREMIPLIEQQS